jgi:hypothetical protein
MWCGFVKDVRTLIEQGDAETMRVIHNIRLLQEKMQSEEIMGIATKAQQYHRPRVSAGDEAIRGTDSPSYEASVLLPHA